MSNNLSIPRPVVDHGNTFIAVSNRSYAVNVPGFGLVLGYGYLAIMELLTDAGWNGQIRSTSTQRVVYIDGKIHLGGPIERDAWKQLRRFAADSGIELQQTS